MGTAPGQQHPLIPTDPGEFVSLSVAALVADGYSERDALGAVARIAALIVRVSLMSGYDTFDFYEGAAEIALDRLAVSDPSSTDREENEHADGRSGHASRDQANQQRR